MTFKTALMNAGAQTVVLGAGIATVNGLFRVGAGAVKLYQMAMSGLAAALALVASGAGVFAAAMRENVAAMASFQYSTNKQFGSAINQARVALSGLERDASLAVLGTKALGAAFTAVSKHAEFTASSQKALKQMANFAYASGNPDKAIAAAGDFIGLLQQKKATIYQIQASMKAAMGDQMYKKVIKEARAKKVKLQTKKQIEEAVMSGKLAELGGVQDMLETMNGTLLGQIKSYLGQAKSLFADFGQPLLAPVKDAFKQIFHTLKFSFMKISTSFVQFTSNKGIPAIVTFVEKASNLVVSLTQKYLPMAHNWFSRLAAPMHTIKTFFKETLPNTLRPYRESAKVITDMFGKIFGPYIGGNAAHLSNLIKDNKQELLTFASGIGQLLGNLNKLSHNIMDAFVRLLPIINPVLNSIGRLVGQIATVFKMLSSLGGLGAKGKHGMGTNLVGSIGSAMMMAMMFKGNKVMGNPETYTRGVSNKGFMGRMFNRAMGLPGKMQQYNRGIYTNRYARQMAYQTGAVAYQPGTAGPGYPGGGSGGGGAGPGGGIPSGAVEPGQLSLYDLSAGGARSNMRGRVSFMNPALMKRSELKNFTIQNAINDEIYKSTGLNNGQISNARLNLGLKEGESAKSLIEEHKRLSDYRSSGGMFTVQQDRRFNDLERMSYGGNLDRAAQIEEQVTLAKQRVMLREQRVANQVANPTGLTPFQKRMKSGIVSGVTEHYTKKGQQHRISQDILRSRGLAKEAQAQAAAQAGDHVTAAKLQRQADKLLHKSAVAGTRADNLQDPYRTTAAGNLERRTDEVTGRQFYRSDRASLRDRFLNRKQGYESAPARGRMIEGKLDELQRKQQTARDKQEMYLQRSDIQQQSGQGMRAKLNRIRANYQENRARGFGSLKSKLLSTEGKTGANRLGILAGDKFKKFSLGKLTGKLGPGGPGIMGARDESGAYKTRTGRVLGGQSQAANMATSIGMSMIAGHMGAEAQGSMALGASIAGMFGPLAGIAVGFGGAALKAKTAKGGAAAGAIAGAAIGTMIPGVGTVVGAAIGAMIGMGMGAWNHRSEQKKNARAVADSIAKGYAQQASRLAFQKYSEVQISGTGLNRKISGTTRADRAIQSFSRFGNQATAFAGMNKQQKLAELNRQASTGQITKDQAKDAGAALDNYTRELTKQAGIYNKLGPIIKQNYNDKLIKITELTGKTAPELEKLAQALGVNLLDPTQSAAEAMKKLGFFIEKSTQQLNDGLRNAMVDSAAALDDWVKSKKAPAVANELAHNFGNLSKSGGATEADFIKYIQDLVPNLNAMSPTDPGAALSALLRSLGVEKGGKINPNAATYTTKGGPLYGQGANIQKIGQGAITQFVQPVQNNLAEEMYGQMQNKAMSMGLSLPGNLLAKLKTMDPTQLADAYSRFQVNPQSLGASSQTYIDKMSSAANPAEKSKLFNTAATNFSTSVNGILGVNSLNAADITSSSTLTSVGNQAVMDLMTPEEKQTLTDLTSQWADVTKAMQSGNSPDWFNRNPSWYDTAPSWYSGDTSSPRGSSAIGATGMPGVIRKGPGSSAIGATGMPGKVGPLTGGDTTSSRLAQTMSRHSQINAGITGKRSITSAWRNHNLGSINSDHVTGRAYDLVGQNLGAYAVAVKNSGGFAEFHGGTANRHLHVVPGQGATGDTRSAASNWGYERGGSMGATSVAYNITVNGAQQSPEQIANVVMEKLKRAERSMNERR
jgi:hypothetical protein